MSVQEDLEACNSSWTRWAGMCDPKWVIGCSLNFKQLRLLRDVLPNASVNDLHQGEWDLSRSPRSFPVDVVVACNVFHYAPNPILWFTNVFASCKYLWLQDLFCRRRGPNEFGADGDCARYTLGGVKVEGVGAFDLSFYENRLMDFQVYDAASYANKRAMINFVALLRGDIE